MINTLAFIGPEPMLIVFLVVLVLFGGKKIPELMRGVGQGIGELKKGVEEGTRTLSEAARPEEHAVRADQAVSSPAPTATPDPAPKG